MSRLYLQIYLTMIGVLLLFAALGSMAHFALWPHDYERDMLNAIAETLAETLPAEGSPDPELQAALERLASRFEAPAGSRGERIPALAPGRTCPGPSAARRSLAGDWCGWGGLGTRSLAVGHGAPGSGDRSGCVSRIAAHHTAAREAPAPGRRPGRR